MGWIPVSDVGSPIEATFAMSNGDVLKRFSVVDAASPYPFLTGGECRDCGTMMSRGGATRRETDENARRLLRKSHLHEPACSRFSAVET